MEKRQRLLCASSPGWPAASRTPLFLCFFLLFQGSWSVCPSLHTENVNPNLNPNLRNSTSGFCGQDTEELAGRGPALQPNTSRRRNHPSSSGSASGGGVSDSDQWKGSLRSQASLHRGCRAPLQTASGSSLKALDQNHPDVRTTGWSPISRGGDHLRKTACGIFQTRPFHTQLLKPVDSLQWSPALQSNW